MQCSAMHSALCSLCMHCVQCAVYALCAVQCAVYALCAVGVVLRVKKCATSYISGSNVLCHRLGRNNMLVRAITCILVYTYSPYYFWYMQRKILQQSNNMLVRAMMCSLSSGFNCSMIPVAEITFWKTLVKYQRKWCWFCVWRKCWQWQWQWMWWWAMVCKE